MKIDALDVFGYQLPLQAALQVKGQVLRQRAGVLLRVRMGAAEGWGEIAPLPGFSAEDESHAEEYFAEVRPRVQETDFEDAAKWLESFDGLFSGGVASTRFGLELALAQAWAAARGVTLREFLAPGAGADVAVNALLAAGSEEWEADADRVKAAGFAAAKIKVGRGTPADEAAKVRRLAERLGEGVRIRLDANRAWTLAEAVSFSRALNGLPVEYVEEPLRRSSELPLFTRDTGLKVALDETLSDTPRSVWEAYEGIAALVVKPTILGGLARSHRMAQLAKGHGWRVVVSSCFESGVGTQALCELAAAYGGADSPAGLDTYRWLADDVLKERLEISPRFSLSGRSAPAVDESKVKRFGHG